MRGVSCPVIYSVPWQEVLVQLYPCVPNMQQIGFGFLSDPALMQGSLLRTVLHRGHMCSLEIQVLPLDVFLELVTTNSAAMIFIVV